LCVDLWLRWGLKQSYRPHWELFNGMSHATYTQGNQVDSWLLVVGIQTTNFIPDPSFGHNLCFRCPNGSCKPILDIYVSITFQCIKNSLNHWVLTFIITLWTFRSPPRLQLPKWKLFWEYEGSFLHTFLYSQASLLAHNLAIPCLGREPKVRVAMWLFHMDFQFNIYRTKTFCLITPTHFTPSFICGTFDWDNHVGARGDDVTTTWIIDPWQLWG